MPQADLSGEADKDVQPQGGDAVDANQNHQADDVAIENERDDQGKGEQAEKADGVGTVRKQPGVAGVIRAKVSAGTGIGNSHQSLSMSLVPNSP